MTYLGSERPRFIVSELEGYTRQGDGRALASHVLPGLSCTVHDRAYCFQVMGVFRTEDRPAGGITWSRAHRQEVTRHLAAELAAELNARTDASTPSATQP